MSSRSISPTIARNRKTVLSLRHSVCTYGQHLLFFPRHSTKQYSFSRPLTQSEWDILQSYTRRIRCIQNFNLGLDWDSVTTFLNPPTTAPFFPNLRSLYCEYTKQTMTLLNLPLPSLVSLNVLFENPHSFPDSVHSFPEFSPNITKVDVYYVSEIGPSFFRIKPSYLCRWQNLRSVGCLPVALDADTLIHLSRMPALTDLEFMLSDILPTSHSTLSFSKLRYLGVESGFLDPISWLLSWIRLPTITGFVVEVDDCPSKQELSFFLVGLQTSATSHTIEVLRLGQLTDPPTIRPEALLLCLEDLQPCMAFSNLLRLDIDIAWNVGLTDGELLTLASGWPHLEHFFINSDKGWNMRGGITPSGLLQLLQRCRSLSSIALVIDTRGYTELPPSGLLGSLGLTSPIQLNVLDSIIEAESVAAIRAFFACTPCSYVDFRGAWEVRMKKPQGWKTYKNRWDAVRSRAGILLEHDISENIHN